MSYLVTGTTGFIGRRLVQQLVERREDTVYVVVREASMARARLLVERWGADRVVPVAGDLTEPGLGVDPEWVRKHRGQVDHLFHLAAVYDMTADAAVNEILNVGGTQHALELAEDLAVGCFHHVSSVAVAGDHRGHFDETMFDQGQHLASPYHRTKFESERLVRETATRPWRVYRPAIVLGDSETGAMDKVDGPYYLFGALKQMRDRLPTWLPVMGVDLGDTNVVPVDYVARALDHLAHRSEGDGQAFHLVAPSPMPVVEMVNAFCVAAGAPRFAVPLDRRVGRLGPLARVPHGLRASSLVAAGVRSRAVQAVLDQTLGRLGIPAEVLGHSSFSAVFGSDATQEALVGSGVAVPDLETYADRLWAYWEENLDTAAARSPATRRALAGKHVVITGASSGIGQVTALKVAQAGGIPVLVARGKDKLEELRATIELRGGTAHVYACDLSDLEAIDRLCEQLSADLESIDFVVNNAGRSIRRSLTLSTNRFHDFERTMALNYFGAIRLVIGLLPAMREQRRGHVVNVSSIGVQTNPPRFSAYVASKAALDAWSNVVASELVGDGVTFTSIHMPLVRTPMIAPTKLYDKFPAISPAQAADLVLRAMVERPHEVNTALGTVGAVGHALAPKLSYRILNMAYHVFPDSAAATGVDGTRESEQIVLARIFKGIHW